MSPVGKPSSVSRRVISAVLPDHWRRSTLRILLAGIDSVGMVLAWVLTSKLLGYAIGPFEVTFIAIIVGLRVSALWALGAYRQVLRYVGIRALLEVIAGLMLGTLAMAFTCAVIDRPTPAFVILEAFLVLMFSLGIRLAARVWFEWAAGQGATRTLIFGAGGLGEATCRAMRRGGVMAPVAFVDDHPAKHGAVIHGKPIAGGLSDLAAIAKRFRAEVLVLAVNHLERRRLREIFAAAMGAGLRVIKVTGVDDMVSGRGELSFDDLALEDLLQRPRRNLDEAPVRDMLQGKTVLVTGAGGSIGSELCRQVAGFRARRLILVDSSEPALYRIGREIADRFPEVGIREALLDVRLDGAIARILADERPDIVVHAAAYKHVPLVEDNPCQAVLNNVGGFLAVVEGCVALDIPRLILISTDKAVRPTNVMGASKRVCELILQSHPRRTSRMGAVRFGNVLGSSGSVVPRFLEQIRSGGPVTVTHPDITRFFMLIPEAVELVLQAGSVAEHGEIFILDMGEPVRIADMARHLIHLTGHVPGRDIDIVFTGLRPGEKLFEELLIDESERSSAIEGITIGKSVGRPWMEVGPLVKDLLESCRRADLPAFAAILQRLVPEWTPSPMARGAPGQDQAGDGASSGSFHPVPAPGYVERPRPIVEGRETRSP